MAISDRIDTRFLARIVVGKESCWFWQGAINNKGYGKVKRDGKQLYVHRYAYEQIVGPIPEGLQLDHLCRNRSCCNPEHLEPVTNSENARRGMTGMPRADQQHAKTHCPKGHEYSGVNLYLTPSGSRDCRTCRKEARGAYEARRRAGVS